MLEKLPGERESRTARSTDSRDERNDDTLRNIDVRNRAQLTTSRDSRLERREVGSERRERMNRLNLAREARESRVQAARDLSSARRSERRTLVDSRRSSEGRSTVSVSPNREQVRADRRQTEQRIDRQRLVDSNRLQRTRATGPAIGARLSREQRLTDRTHLSLALPRTRSLNDARRSRVVDPDLARLSDSAARLSRVPSANARLFASRAKIPGVPGILNQEHSIKDGLTFDVIRQAIVIGLCAVYGLSMFHGKRSFIR